MVPQYRCFPVLILAVLLAWQTNAMAEPRSLGNISFPAGTRTDLQLSVPAGPSDPATFIPVSMFSGTEPGPRLLVVAGVHGFEFASILALQKLAQTTDPKTLRGSLMLVKLAHVAAFEARSPYVNPYDRKNLNRVFPGSADGSQAERIAWVLSNELISKADFVIDVHSGDGAEWLDAFVGVYGGRLAAEYKLALTVARAFQFPNIVRYRMETQEQIDQGRSLNRQAVAAGVPTLLVEIGQNGSRDPAHVAAIVEGLENAMRTLGMLSDTEPVAMAPATRLFDGTASVPVQHSGIWSPRSTSGRLITEGEELGVINGYDGRVLEQVRAPISGYALYGLAGPPVRAGESVMTIAKPVDTLQ